jgi:hypothetical protein
MRYITSGILIFMLLLISGCVSEPNYSVSKNQIYIQSEQEMLVSEFNKHSETATQDTTEMRIIIEKYNLKS